MKIKRGDKVLVLTGDYRPQGDEAKKPTPRVVQQVLDGGEKVIVEGVNLVYKHVKRGHPKSPQGGRLRMEKPIHSSNVQFFCDKCQKGVRLGMRYLEDGSKERFCRKCKTSVGQVSPPRAAHAKK